MAKISLPANVGDARDAGSVPGLGRSPGEGHGNPFLVLLPGKFHGQRSLVGYSRRGRKESDMTERLHFLSIILFNRHLVIKGIMDTVQFQKL